MINRPILIAAGAAVAVLAAAGPSFAGVAGAPTTTAVTASTTTLTTSQTVDLTATISSAAPPAICSGVVRYERAGFGPMCSTAVATAALGASTAHVCSQTGASMGVGAHAITAVYEGNGTCAASVSAPITVTVLAAPSAVPTVGEWTMWGLAGVLLIGGGVIASRRFRATAA